MLHNFPTRYECSSYSPERLRLADEGRVFSAAASGLRKAPISVLHPLINKTLFITKPLVVECRGYVKISLAFHPVISLCHFFNKCLGMADEALNINFVIKRRE